MDQKLLIYLVKQLSWLGALLQGMKKIYLQVAECLVIYPTINQEHAQILICLQLQSCYDLYYLMPN